MRRDDRRRRDRLEVLGTERRVATRARRTARGSRRRRAGRRRGTGRRRRRGRHRPGSGRASRRRTASSPARRPDLHHEHAEGDRDAEAPLEHHVEVGVARVAVVDGVAREAAINEQQVRDGGGIGIGPEVRGEVVEAGALGVDVDGMVVRRDQQRRLVERDLGVGPCTSSVNRSVACTGATVLDRHASRSRVGVGEPAQRLGPKSGRCPAYTPRRDHGSAARPRPRGCGGRTSASPPTGRRWSSARRRAAPADDPGDPRPCATGSRRARVYRNLVVLEQAGVVHRIVTNDEFARFELAEDLTGDHHHHLICSSCGAVEDVPASAGLEQSLQSGRRADRRGRPGSAPRPPHRPARCVSSLRVSTRGAQPLPPRRSRRRGEHRPWSRRGAQPLPPRRSRRRGEHRPWSRRGAQPLPPRRSRRRGEHRPWSRAGLAVVLGIAIGRVLGRAGVRPRRRRHPADQLPHDGRADHAGGAGVGAALGRSREPPRAAEHHGTATSIVVGYDGEPYLRVGPRGMFENTHSPAVYLNKSANTTPWTPPKTADPAAPPEWRQVSPATTAVARSPRALDGVRPTGVAARDRGSPPPDPEVHLHLRLADRKPSSRAAKSCWSRARRRGPGSGSRSSLIVLGIVARARTRRWAAGPRRARRRSWSPRHSTSSGCGARRRQSRRSRPRQSAVLPRRHRARGHRARAAARARAATPRRRCCCAPGCSSGSRAGSPTSRRSPLAAADHAARLAHPPRGRDRARPRRGGGDDRRAAPAGPAAPPAPSRRRRRDTRDRRPGTRPGATRARCRNAQGAPARSEPGGRPRPDQQIAATVGYGFTAAPPPGWISKWVWVAPPLASPVLPV